MRYVDGFVLPVPKKNLRAYRTLTQKAGKIWREHGALEYRECVGDDLNIKWALPFPRLSRLKRGETVVFSMDRVQVESTSRCSHREGDERPAHRVDDGPYDDALRPKAYGLRRIQGHR
jgi:uncharacterized protein YbaA (DUF1428 family)